MERNLYQRVLDFQDACNLSGVIKEMSFLTKEIWEEAREKGKGTDYVNNHPAMVLFKDKICHLCNGLDVMDAWTICEERANK